MISFSKFITEGAPRVPKKQLHVFDIDDTLLHTTAKVHVLDSKGKRVRSLSNSEYNSHRLKTGHRYDFSEFRSAHKFATSSKPIHHMISHLKKVASDPSNHVIMNTARSNFDDKNKFLGTFKSHGIPMHKIHVIRAGNISGSGSPAHKKALVIHGYINKHKYDHVHMYDDSKHNLSVFSDLKKHHPNTTFHAHHVVGGTVSESNIIPL